MTALRFAISLLMLAACASTEEVCFDAATRDYVAARTAIAKAEAAAARGYVAAPEQLDFIDVSECGPILEDRAICTSQSSVSLPDYHGVDAQAEAQIAENLSAQLPRLRADAEAAYRACLLSGRAK